MANFALILHSNLFRITIRNTLIPLCNEEDGLLLFNDAIQNEKDDDSRHGNKGQVYGHKTGILRTRGHENEEKTI